MLDDISEAVLANEDVARYLRGGYGDSGAQAREKINSYLDELRTTQRYKFYRALQHPLYPILRKIERKHENLAPRHQRRRKHRIVYASNHKSHCDYLVEPLVLDDNGIRPPLIVAGINLFGGPLGLIHRHVTGAIPIRRSDQGSGLPDHVQGLRRRGAEEARSVLLSGRRAQLQRRAEAVEDRAVQRRARRRASRPGDHPGGDRLRSRARGSHPRAPEREEAAAAVRPRGRGDGALRGRLPVARVRHLRRADYRRRSRRPLAQRRPRAGAAGPRRASARSTRCCRRRSSPRRCGRRSRAAISSRASIG